MLMPQLVLSCNSRVDQWGENVMKISRQCWFLVSVIAASALGSTVQETQIMKQVLSDYFDACSFF